MSTAVAERPATLDTEPPRRQGAAAVSAGAVLGVALAGWGMALEWQSGSRRPAVAAAVVTVWAVAATALAGRASLRPLARLAVAVAAIGGAGLLAAGGVGRGWSGPAGTLAGLVRPLALCLLPAVGLHLLLGLPEGRLVSRPRRVAAVAGYAAAVVVGLALWADRPDLDRWPVALEACAAALVGVPASYRRYRDTVGPERQRLQWLGCAVAVLAEVAVVLLALRVLVGWPHRAGFSLVAVSALVPAALAAGASSRLVARADRLLVATVSLAGLSGVVVATYLVVVVGLGRVPGDEERTLLLLSMAAAGLAAALYLPARERLSRFANALVYGERDAPDEVLRSFGTRLSRAIPLDELLLQLAESLRKTMALAAAEVWTGGDGVYERAVSVPERDPARLTVGPQEEPVVARAGVSGPAWLRVWLPAMLSGREGVGVRVAPVTNSGDLLGLIVVERRAGADPFTEEEDQVLAELARQVGLALHNVQLDSALQASLDEVRRQAEELRASRARIVAASDAARRQIERDLHDGAQQHLVALAVTLGLARQLAEDDPAETKALLDQLASDLKDTLQELRNLAHGIYPPLLVDAGLPDALRAAAGRSPLRTVVEVDGVGRHPPDVEAATYFCCLEALQNAAKHAGKDAVVTVRVWEEENGLLFEVADDGAGFEPSVHAQGQGFVNMSDRLGAIGGRLEVDSEPGQGTRVRGAIPIG